MRVPDVRQWLVAGDFASAYRCPVGVAAQPAAITSKSTHEVDRNITRPPKRTHDRTPVGEELSLLRGHSIARSPLKQPPRGNIAAL